jgi:hypothetical protein
MKTIQYLGSLALIGTLVSSLAGCMVEAGFDAPVVVERTGGLRLEWTIDGRDDGVAGADYGVSSVEVDVYDAFGDYVTTSLSRCDDHAVTIDLPEGDFDADATLVDDFGDAMSTTATVERLDVISGTDLVVDLDFPAASML